MFSLGGTQLLLIIKAMLPEYTKNIILKKAMKTLFSALITLAFSAMCPLDALGENVQTSHKLLSGHDSGDAVQWDFYCTDGRNSGKWTTIGVPSCWEMQGFGTLQYGYGYNSWNMFPATSPIADETGYYRHAFPIPPDWAGRQVEIVFEASMTDTEVKVNGQLAGEVHQGGFSPFRYDITDKLRCDGGDNQLEVKVCKESGNRTMNLAQRRCDFWNFGGIIRPVYLVSKPKSNIERVAIDADMNGNFRADCFVRNVGGGWTVKTTILDEKGMEVKAGKRGGNVNGETCVAVAGQESIRQDSLRISLSVTRPRLWTAETPCLYTAVFSLVDPLGKVVHRESQKFGFRTIEVMERDGVYVNGKRIMFKGVNRDSFNPETGRTLSKRNNIDDVLLIKSMNMNAVRLNDYPADPSFYDACDSLGLYVLAELSGWQTPQETPVGRRLVREMVTRDVNHPSIVFWCSGNEGGFNYELEPDFRRHDIQKRTVLYPWSETRNGIRTRHYRSYDDVRRCLATGDIYMPTEFLHGLYDGGTGAGLADYWQLMKSCPNSAGGFLWCLADEGLVRNDLGGTIDCQGNLAADGIVGPYHEREGSYYTIKQLWSPIRLSYGDGNLSVENDYDFRTLDGCKIVCEWMRNPIFASRPSRLKLQTLRCPPLQPKRSGKIRLRQVDGADMLRLAALDTNGDTLFVWGERLRKPSLPSVRPVAYAAANGIDRLDIKAGGNVFSFSETNGLLKQVTVGGKVLRLGNGPRFIAARRADRGRKSVARGSQKDFRLYLDDARFAGFALTDSGKLTSHYEGGYLKDVEWTFMDDGYVKVRVKYRFSKVVDIMGVMFDYPESHVLSKSWMGNGPYRVWQNRLAGPQYGYWHNEYNDPVPGETFEYPEFKGYFANVDWMRLETTEGDVGIVNLDNANYIGVYEPEDGRDNFLYRLPDTGISVLRHIPAVRTKVHYSDELGPSAQPHVATGDQELSFLLKF